MGTVTKSIVVNAPLAQVFAFWENFENFPRFMENIESIQVIGEDMTHWKTKGPLGTAIEWDARTTYVERNKKIAWQTIDGQIETHGAVLFKEAGPQQTEVTVGLEYQPPGGALGEAVAKLFSNPEDQLEEDLNRFKQVAESGDFAMISGNATAGSGRPHAAAYTGGSESTLTGGSATPRETGGESTGQPATGGVAGDTYSTRASDAEANIEGGADASRTADGHTTAATDAVEGVRSGAASG